MKFLHKILDIKISYELFLQNYFTDFIRNFIFHDEFLWNFIELSEVVRLAPWDPPWDPLTQKYGGCLNSMSGQKEGLKWTFFHFRDEEFTTEKTDLRYKMNPRTPFVQYEEGVLFLLFVFKKQQLNNHSRF